MGWSKEQAIEYMLKHTSMGRISIEKEIDRKEMHKYTYKTSIKRLYYQVYFVARASSYI